MPSEFMLDRHGLPPLKFTGDLIADESSRSNNGPRQNRWHDLSLYITTGGKFVVQIMFCTLWQGEEDRSIVYVADDQQSLIDAMTAKYDPCSGWTGHPLGVADAERKNALLADSIVGGYRQAVSNLFAGAGIIEEVA